MRMLILYLLLVAYILAVNFYAFLLVKALRDKEKQAEELKKAQEILKPTATTAATAENLSSTGVTTSTPPERVAGKLCITGLLGGAITIYVCMFVLKYKRSDLLLMVLMPLLGVLNIYLWVILFKSGFSFFLIR